MVEVKQIPVDILLPVDKVQIVTLQSFFRMPSPTEEPFQWENRMS